MAKIPQNKIDLLVANFPTHTNKELRVICGLSRLTINKYAKILGLKKEISISELSKRGITHKKKTDPTAYNNWVAGNKERIIKYRNVSHTGVYTLQNKTAEEMADIIKRRAATNKRNRDRDKLRYKMGLQPLQRYNANPMTKQQVYIRTLKKTLSLRGYLASFNSKYIYYSDSTDRTKREAYLTRKYGFIFEQYSESKQIDKKDCIIVPDWSDLQGGFSIS